MAGEKALLHRSRLYERYVSSGQAGAGAEPMDRLPQRDAYFRKLIRDHFPADRDARILDLGCGHGALLAYCQSLGYRSLEGVDASAEQIAVGHRRGLEKLVQGDLLGYLRATPRGSLDVVVAFDVLEHFTRSEIFEIIQEIWEVLAPGGRFVMHSPNGESPFFGATLYGDFTHELAFHRASLSQISRTIGFSSLYCVEDKPVVRGFVSMVRRLLWEILRQFFVFATAVETGGYDRSAIFTRNLLAVHVK
jgi:2-polyprenyl-3-methyl-5-hydroxy-6-metoxy-1,4-benzoquinol methylase